MKKPIIELFGLLTPRQRKHFYALQVLVIMMSIAEIVGIASIAPFVSLVGNINMLQGDNIMARLYQMSGIASSYDFVLLVGACSLTALTIGATVSIITIWRLAVFGSHVGMELGDRLYNYYIHKDWLFHASGMSSVLIKKVSSDANTVARQMIQPVLNINAKLVLVVFIIIPVFAFNPLVSLICIVIFSGSYLLLYRWFRPHLMRNGARVSRNMGQRYALMSEGFGGIKEILLLQRQTNFTSRFEAIGKRIAHGQSNTQTLSQIPYRFVEVVAFGSVILLVLYLTRARQSDLSAILPILSVYALAGLRMLSAFQQIYSDFANIKYATSAYNNIREDLREAGKIESVPAIESKPEPLPLNQQLELSNINFTYPGKEKPALDGLNLVITANKVVGIVGSTGSGKSTAVDMILGLIKPCSGGIKVDGNSLNEAQLSQWQRAIGFVSQTIYLSNASITQNIAFGLAEEDIDLEKVRHAIKLAHLEELVSELPEKEHTIVGERGVQLSGGQRQRIGIARALYNDAKILVLDEATSALDGITEKVIMDAIHDFTGSKTIIMIAHRFTTIQKCDIIYFMDKGKVIDQGTYDELYQRNPTFKKMANNA